MSRIPLTNIGQQPEPIREFVARRGDLDVFRLLANAPEVFAGWAQMVDDLFDSPTFSLRMRELIILRVAQLQGSRYELSRHADVARAASTSTKAPG
jgi:4-carboxymuconolactone decarboxylase